MCDGACQGSGGADGVAPGVIFIPYHFRAVFVNQGDDVVLGVPDKQRSPVIRFATCCYTRTHCGPVYVPVAAGRHADQLPSAVVAEVGYGDAFLPGKDPAARQSFHSGSVMPVRSFVLLSRIQLRIYIILQHTDYRIILNYSRG